MSSSIVGAWELDPDTEVGLIVATETHVSTMITAKNRQHFRSSEPTEGEEAEAYRSFIAQIGPYTVAGARLIHH